MTDKLFQCVCVCVMKRKGQKIEFKWDNIFHISPPSDVNWYEIFIYQYFYFLIIIKAVYSYWTENKHELYTILKFNCISGLIIPQRCTASWNWEVLLFRTNSWEYYPRNKYFLVWMEFGICPVIRYFLAVLRYLYGILIWDVCVYFVGDIKPFIYFEKK